MIYPDDRRAGARQQSHARSQVNRLIEEERLRRRGMSRHARSGVARLPRVRGAGPRFAAGKPGGALAALMQMRGPGVSANARIPFDIPEFAPPRIETPGNALPLPGDPVSTGEEQPPLLGNPPLHVPERQRDTYANPEDEKAVGPGMGAQDPSKAFGPGLDIGGLIPMGNGVWYDPAQNIFYGGPGGSATGMQ